MEIRLAGTVHVSLVVPVFNEADNIQPFLRDVEAQVREPHEILIVYDFPEDNTLPAVAAMQPPCPDVRLVHNTLGRGVLNALKAGFQASRGDVVVVMMADRSDEPHDVAAMARLVREGADVVAGSRYMRGGRQEGGPLLKRTLSRLAGVSLHYLAGLPIHDATNNFRAYSRRVIEQIPDRGRSQLCPGAGADAQGPLARLAHGRGADHLARPHGGAVAFPPVGVAAALSALVSAGAETRLAGRAGLIGPLALHLPTCSRRKGRGDSVARTARRPHPSKTRRHTVRPLILSLALLAGPWPARPDPRRCVRLRLASAL